MLSMSRLQGSKRIFKRLLKAKGKEGRKGFRMRFDARDEIRFKPNEMTMRMRTLERPMSREEVSAERGDDDVVRCLDVGSVMEMRWC